MRRLSEELRARRLGAGTLDGGRSRADERPRRRPRLRRHRRLRRTRRRLGAARPRPRGRGGLRRPPARLRRLRADGRRDLGGRWPPMAIDLPAPPSPPPAARRGCGPQSADDRAGHRLPAPDRRPGGRAGRPAASRRPRRRAARTRPSAAPPGAVRRRVAARRPASPRSSPRSSASALERRSSRTGRDLRGHGRGAASAIVDDAARARARHGVAPLLGRADGAPSRSSWRAPDASTSSASGLGAERRRSRPTCSGGSPTGQPGRSAPSTSPGPDRRCETVGSRRRPVSTTTPVTASASSPVGRPRRTPTESSRAGRWTAERTGDRATPTADEAPPGDRDDRRARYDADDVRSLRERVAETRWRRRLRGTPRRSTTIYRIVRRRRRRPDRRRSASSRSRYPGPGWLIVIAGLFVLATEFTWAERLLRVHQAARQALDGLGRPASRSGSSAARAGSRRPSSTASSWSPCTSTACPSWVPGWVPLWR